MTTTATRLDTEIGSTRTLYKLSEIRGVPEFKFLDYTGEMLRFDHVVLSLGSGGDTCAFPADADGKIMQLIGFGFGMGPSRWLTEPEFDRYIDACIAEHHRDNRGLAWATDWRAD